MIPKPSADEIAEILDLMEIEPCVIAAALIRAQDKVVEAAREIITGETIVGQYGPWKLRDAPTKLKEV